MRYLLPGILFFMTQAQGQLVINTISPSSGPVGTLVTITGSNFSPTASNNIVYFGARTSFLFFAILHHPAHLILRRRSTMSPAQPLIHL